MIILFVIVVGLIFGSFIAAYTYRFGKGLSNFSGRSFCDKCKKQIYWYDNIPLLSYLVLSGKCRFCKKGISPRYPVIEAFTSFVFVSFYIISLKCNDSPICLWNTANSSFFYIYFYIILILLISVFIIDYENYIIPDELIYLLTFTAIIGNVFFPGLSVYSNLFSGFMAASFLLVLHLVTQRKGMGLGDVKLSISIGLLLGFKYTLYFLLISFLLGAFVGIILIIKKRKNMKSQIPFGPFLVISFFLVFFFGDMITI